jgi:hypothetical protein
MRFIASILAALGLALAVPAAASAEPKQDSDHYWVVGVSPVYLVLLGGNIEVNGDHRQAWVAAYFSQTLESKINDQKVDILWVLSDYTCSKGSVRSIRSETQATGVTGATPINPPAEELADSPPQPGSSQAHALGTVCGTSSDLKSFTAAETAKLMVDYRKAVSETPAEH